MYIDNIRKKKTNKKILSNICSIVWLSIKKKNNIKSDQRQKQREK